jgi:hypothetical protein
VRVKDAQSGRMVDDYWEASKGMLMEADFLGSLRAYDKDHIDPGIIKRIKVSPAAVVGQRAAQRSGGCCSRMDPHNVPKLFCVALRSADSK